MRSKEEELTEAAGAVEARERDLDQIRLMQRPRVTQRRGSTVAAELENNTSRGRRWKRRGKGESEKDPWPYLKANGLVACTGIEELKSGYVTGPTPRLSEVH